MLCVHFQAPLSNIAEVQNSIMDELINLTFVKDNAQKLMERKVSFERQRDKKIAVRERKSSRIDITHIWRLNKRIACNLYYLDPWSVV